MKNDQIVQANRQNIEALKEELALLERCIVLTENSPLNRGILFIPEGLTAEPRTDSEQEDDVIVSDMLEGLPYTVRGPEHLIKDIKWYPPKDINLDIEKLRNRAEYLQYRIDLLNNFEKGMIQ
jgi:hypothetical protein